MKKTMLLLTTLARLSNQESGRSPDGLDTAISAKPNTARQPKTKGKRVLILATWIFAAISVPADSLDNEYRIAERNLEAVWNSLTPEQRARHKSDEIAWIAYKDSQPLKERIEADKKRTVFLKSLGDSDSENTDRPQSPENNAKSGYSAVSKSSDKTLRCEEDSFSWEGWQIHLDRIYVSRQVETGVMDQIRRSDDDSIFVILTLTVTNSSNKGMAFIPQNDLKIVIDGNQYDAEDIDTDWSYIRNIEPTLTRVRKCYFELPFAVLSKTATMDLQFEGMWTGKKVVTFNKVD